MNKKNDENKNKLVWIRLFFEWLSKFTLTLIDDIWTRRIIAFAVVMVALYFCTLILIKATAFFNAMTFSSIQF